MIRKATLIGIACAVLVLLACTPPPAPAAPTSPPRGGTAAQQPQGWQQEWEQTLAGARQEGNLTVSTSIGSEYRVEIGKRFKEKFGLDIDWIPIPAAQVSPKLFRERQAGLYTVDFQMAALSRQLGELKPGGALDPLKSMLILPEVLDKNAWYGGDVPWCDDDKAYIVNNILAPENFVSVNTDLVKPGQIKSYNDLLDPLWKGKMVFTNPVLNGRVPAIMNSIMGPDYLRKLAEQAPLIVDDHRLGFDAVARGKYAIMLSTRMDMLGEFQRAGAPVAKVILQEGTTLTGGLNSLSLINRAPHPNAAKIFANWWLGKEFGAHLSRFLGSQSARLDVPTDHLRPEDIRDPSTKYVFSEKEDFQKMQLEVRDQVQQVFGPLMK
ncbi:MAG: extracellular solute-binding protein [Chloroflexi bacterium]|nr:extracellular solute-binding protein [Chloroflexota bacterium]